MSADLSGRAHEVDVLNGLVTRARAGLGGALVLRGAPGVGKSALLRAAAQRAEGLTVLRTRAVDGGPHAALRILLQPLVEAAGFTQGPVAQAERSAEEWSRAACAFRAILDARPRPEALEVGDAAVRLICAAAKSRPILCLVDDIHLVDRESAAILAFTARRLSGRPAAFIASCCDNRRPPEFVGIPELPVGGLNLAAVGELLANARGFAPSPATAWRVAAATGGNPAAVLDVATVLTSLQLNGLEPLPDPLPHGPRAAGLVRRLAALPDTTRWCLLAAAAEPDGELELLSSALLRAGLSPAGFAAAAAEDLLEIGATVTFRHPLMRVAAYGAATSSERRLIHRLLADVGRTRLAPQRLAWHRRRAEEQVRMSLVPQELGKHASARLAADVGASGVQRRLPVSAAKTRTLLPNSRAASHSA